MNTTRTFRYLMGPPAGGTLKVGPLPPMPPGRIPLVRLGVTASPKLDYTQDQLARSIAEIDENTIFLCDSSFFDRQTDQAVYESLLARKAGLGIIPSVWLESKKWADKNSDVPIARALLDKHQGIRLYDPDAWEVVAQYCYRYYTRLLGARKLLFPYLEGEFEHDHGRPPTPDEMQVLKRDAHDRSIGPRDYMIGKKAAGKPRSPTFYTDEQIVVAAFVLAIACGVSVIILTKDEDIQEQFYKMQHMIDSQYRSMLFADGYEAARRHSSHSP